MNQRLLRLSALALTLTPALAHAQLEPANIIFIFDTSGSTGALIPNWQANVFTQFAVPLEAIRPGSRFALAKHEDFPINGFGSTGDVPYALEFPLTPISDWATLIQPQIDSLTNGSGGDSPESQYPAIFLSLMGGGMDLNCDGDFLDVALGEVDPADNVMGIDPTQDCMVFHLSNPDSNHDSDVELSYPAPGCANLATPGKSDVQSLFTSMGDRLNYYHLTTGPLLDSALDVGGLTELAALSGGFTISVGPSLEGLKDAAIAAAINEGGSPATVTSRNAGPNPFVYGASPAVLGANYQGIVDNFASGFSSAGIYMATAPDSVPLAGIGTLLLDLSAPGPVLPIQSGPILVFNAPIPNDPVLSGLTLYTQALLLSPATATVGLSNAQDLLLGQVAIP